ncbi:MAG: hypothetical protein C6W57_06735 [Caldibacillus debilis]|nr:MAG: hypothetical protein C6W57_06735 [Caldibacillus debilis]
MPESFYGIRFLDRKGSFLGKGGKGFRFAELVPCHIFVFFGKGARDPEGRLDMNSFSSRRSGSKKGSR